MAMSEPPAQAKTLWVREPYVSQILSGRKRVEVRVAYPNILRLRPGDRLNLNDQHLVTIARIGRYDDFEALLAAEDPAAIAPDLAPEELLGALRDIYGPDKEALGVIALEVVLPRRYDTILFDLGYTLVYFDPPQEVAVREALQAAAGVERSIEEIGEAARAVWGEYYRDAESITFPATQEYDRESQAALHRRLLAHLGVEADPGFLEAYTTALEAQFNRPGALRTYPEVLGVLEALRAQGYVLGIVSNWSWNLRRRVEQVRLESYFQVIWASAYAGCNKPHPEIFSQAVRQIDPPLSSPARALYVGDSYDHDVVGARKAGLDVLLVDRDGTAGDRDCLVIRDLWGVLDYLGSSSASG